MGDYREGIIFRTERGGPLKNRELLRTLVVFHFRNPREISEKSSRLFITKRPSRS